MRHPRLVATIAGPACAALIGACAASTPPQPEPPPPPPQTSPAPSVPAGDPPPVTEGDVTVARVRGMEIIVKRTPGAEFVAGQLGIRGGARDWTAENAGIEHVALDVATSGGTQTLAKEPFARKLAALGATINGDAGNDFATLSAKAPKGAWDELFPIFVETFLAPALPASEFEIAKKQDLAARRHELEDGDGRLWLLARKAIFAGHPYANRSVGTIESIEKLKAEDLAPHLAKLRDTNRLVLVIAGDVDPTHMIDQARAAFATVARGSYAETPMPPLAFSGSHVSGNPFRLPTNYIESVFAGPVWSNPDFAPLRMGMAALSHRVWEEVRSKRNLSYAPQAFFDFDRGAPFAVLYVTATDPDTTMRVMFDEARRLQSEPIGAKELEGTRSVFLTEQVQQHEATDGQASLLLDAVMLGGDWRVAQKNLDAVRSATPEAIQRAAKKWLGNAQTAIVGDPQKLDPKVVGAR